MTETRTVEVQVEVVKPLPSALTDPIPYPIGLAPDYTVGDLRKLAFDLYDLLDQANADREKALEITSSEAGQ